MKPLVALVSLFTLVSILGVASAASAGDARVVGGITPDRRPEGLPVVAPSTLSDAGRKSLLHGVTKPYPASIKHWIDDQGGWFTPFSHPGMTGPYDIRNWHEKSNG